MVELESETTHCCEPMNVVAESRHCEPEPGSSLGRRRALSVASTQPSVETVIVKAKRAATSLWLLLHAQSCNLASKCPNPGCREAKMLLLHLKTCSASSDSGPSIDCPAHHHGCDQARKLLAHYRRCRSLRAKCAGSQLGVLPSRHPRDPHHCLVCSLVARQARSMLERTGSPTSASKFTSGRALSTTSCHVDASLMFDDSEQVVLTQGGNQMLPPPPRPKSLPSNFAFPADPERSHCSPTGVAPSDFAEGPVAILDDMDALPQKRRAVESSSVLSISPPTCKLDLLGWATAHVDKLPPAMDAVSRGMISTSCETILEERSQASRDSTSSVDFEFGSHMDVGDGNKVTF